jgi:hypothetical protein
VLLDLADVGVPTNDFDGSVTEKPVEQVTADKAATPDYRELHD